MSNNISNCYVNFQNEIDGLLDIDVMNQKTFSSSGINKNQIEMMTEAVFLFAFRSYENFMRDVFLMCCMEEKTSSLQETKSFLKPRDIDHAQKLIQSSMPFLDWSSPETLISRAETYLDNDGFPIKIPCSSAKVMLKEMKSIRNHISHNSKESESSYKKVLLGHFGVMPLILMAPGEYLLLSDKKDKKKYKLQVYLNFLKSLPVSLG